MLAEAVRAIAAFGAGAAWYLTLNRLRRGMDCVTILGAIVVVRLQFAFVRLRRPLLQWRHWRVGPALRIGGRESQRQRDQCGQ